MDFRELRGILGNIMKNAVRKVPFKGVDDYLKVQALTNIFMRGNIKITR